MEKKPLIIISCLILALMLMTATPKISIANAANGTYLKLVSDVTELGPDNAVGQNFTVKCIIENVTNLYGLDIQINWTTEYIEYVSHLKTIPVETYPDGILHSPTVPVKDEVDENANMTGSAPGTMYWISEASMVPAEVFNGTGMVFNMTFRVKNHPASDSHIIINFTASTLSDKKGDPIPHTRVGLDILLHGRIQPSGPEIRISSPSYKGAVPYVFDVNVSILNLDPYWDLAGFDIQLSYCTEVMQATNLNIDPDGWFNSFWNTTRIIEQEIDNLNGKIWVAVLGLPGTGGIHDEPYGNATLFTVTFEAYASGPIKKVPDSFSLAAFPHPERPEPPFNNTDWSVPIPFTVTDGLADIVGVIDHTPLTGYTVTTESNSSVSSLFFEPGVPMLLFNVTGCDGCGGFCNITIPKDFMWSSISDGWFVLVNGEPVTPTITEDADNTYIYFTYEHSTNHITIITTNAVPELGFVALAILALSASVIALTKRQITGKKK